VSRGPKSALTFVLQCGVGDLGRTAPLRPHPACPPPSLHPLLWYDRGSSHSSSYRSLLSTLREQLLLACCIQLSPPRGASAPFRIDRCVCLGRPFRLVSRSVPSDHTRAPHKGSHHAQRYQPMLLGSAQRLASCCRCCSSSLPCVLGLAPATKASRCGWRGSLRSKHDSQPRVVPRVPSRPASRALASSPDRCLMLGQRGRRRQQRANHHLQNR
jgi:hypothetical protein